MEQIIGCQQTQIGVFPEDWDVQLLSTLIDIPIQNGVFNAPGKKNKGCKLINVGDLYSSIPIYHNNLYLLDVNKSEIACFGVANGDIFFTRSSLTTDGIAQCNIYNNPEIEDVVFDSHVIRVRVNKKKVDPFYLFRYCTAFPARKYLFSHAKTTTMTTIDQGIIANLPIPLPPLREQHLIAATLSDVDALLSALDVLIAKKRLIKQGAMQELLMGKKRLPGFTDEWELKKLGDVIQEIADGGTPPTTNPNYFGGNIYWAVIDDIKNEIFETQQTLTESGLAKSSSNLWKPGTIILSTGATIGEVGITRVNIATKQGICGIVVNKKTSNVFLKYWFQQNKYSLVSKAQGSSIREIRPPTLVQLEITLPSIQEQQAIAEILSDMDTEIAALEARREKTRLLKQGMMQELLTGRIRLV
jgi:type I restriction enzyme S subunit